MVPWLKGLLPSHGDEADPQGEASERDNGASEEPSESFTVHCPPCSSAVPLNLEFSEIFPMNPLFSLN